MSGLAEGTLLLDGLIEGVLPDQADMERRLRNWIAEAGKQGLIFHLEIEGSSFSLLPENFPLPAQRLGPSPAEMVSRLLDDLASSLPRPERDRMFSTLRSRETRKDSEVQTVYALRNGVVEPLARTVELPASASVRQRRRLPWSSGVAILLALAALFALDAGGILTLAKSMLGRAESEDIALDASAFGDLLNVQSAGVRGNPRAYRIMIERGPGFPVDDAAMLHAINQADSVARRLALESLARGYARCEFFDAAGRFVTVVPCRLRELHGQKRSEVSLPLPENVRVRRAALTY